MASSAGHRADRRHYTFKNPVRVRKDRHKARKQWFAARAVVDERVSVAGSNEYCIDWEGDDPATGSPWAPSWVSEGDVRETLLSEWRQLKAGGDGEGAAVEEAATGQLPVDGAAIDALTVDGPHGREPAIEGPVVEGAATEEPAVRGAAVEQLAVGGAPGDGAAFDGAVGEGAARMDTPMGELGHLPSPVLDVVIDISGNIDMELGKGIDKCIDKGVHQGITQGNGNGNGNNGQVEAAECPICTELVSELDIVMLTPCCSQIVCSDCFGEWHKQSHKCPYCRGW